MPSTRRPVPALPVTARLAAAVPLAVLLAVLLAVPISAPAFAAGAEGTAEAGLSRAVLPWGDALAAVAQGAAAAALPLLAAAATAALARVAGPLRFLVTSSLVERLVRNVGDYAVNAVTGAVRGKTLTVPLGSAVIAAAVQRAADQAPAWLVREAGGLEGLAEKVFRSLPLEEAADAGNTLRPALKTVRRRAVA